MELKEKMLAFDALRFKRDYDFIEDHPVYEYLKQKPLAVSAFCAVLEAIDKKMDLDEWEVYLANMMFGGQPIPEKWND